MNSTFRIRKRFIESSQSRQLNKYLPRTTESPTCKDEDEWEWSSRRVLPQSHACKPRTIDMVRGKGVVWGLQILGDGQIWDLKGILSPTSQETFEDLFSGRALVRMAQDFDRNSPIKRKLFIKFREKGRITGLGVAKALLSNNQQAKNAAKLILRGLAKNGALGIKALNEGKGFKQNWSAQKRNYWKNFNAVIIGGGISKGITGRVLINSIKRYLLKDGLADIKVYRAKFAGKEAGYLGSAISILEIICKEGKEKNLAVIAGIGLDLGREEIGVGLLAINPDSNKIILWPERRYWLFQRSVKTPDQKYLKIFLDSRKDYTKEERLKGRRIRKLILKQMANLIILAKQKAQESGLTASRNIAVAVPGRISPHGYIIDSTDYLPFFRKQDGFNFPKKLEELLIKRGLPDYHIHIINDGIASGIANAYFGLSKLKQGKFVFLGVGSGLGGCVGQVITR